MMGCKKTLCFFSSFSCLRVSFLLIGLVSHVSSSSFISDGVFDSRASTGRNLLQAKKSCPINFEFQNYSIITSQCKGPNYPPSLCCSSFVKFACPFAAELNDLSNECATTMFSYINLYGKYPPGLFASECREGKEGLACPANPPGTSANASSSSISCHPSSIGVLAFLLLGLLTLLI